MKSPSAGATMAVMLLLLTFGVGLGSTMDAVHAPLDLDLAPNSVDDMYNGCVSEMEKVASEFLEKEKNGNQNFKMAWDKAREKFHRKSKLSDLQMRQRMAVYAYTLEQPKLYAEFNQAVRTEASSYRTTFQYHALHFYLTTALRKLKLKQGKRCRIVYRRVGLSFSRDVMNKPFRFGSFTSSSMDGYASPAFGKTCFMIETCFGADISQYSEFPNEHELLIPPYEVFTVISVRKYPRPTCDAEYWARSDALSELSQLLLLMHKHLPSLKLGMEKPHPEIWPEPHIEHHTPKGQSDDDPSPQSLSPPTDGLSPDI
ncbi:ecto-ADP-ribosyltransferase 5-like [Synchiropus splendidus]|uniref:ecto-ADP-ribosyltransferase 5-like n=1 Tax=Synchiropus splendidus TaxID=270530 RepID=UPI00237E2B16|nr:ecto-ADP-ribosyltransferase 5-like [Synchiropus splendidus]